MAICDKCKIEHEKLGTLVFNTPAVSDTLTLNLCAACGEELLLTWAAIDKKETV